MNAREWADKDYYADLGVSSSATADDIKKAYRKLARENHPDKNPGDKRAEERFKRAAEAYDIIGDEKKRAEYDETKALLASGGFGGFGGKGGPGFPGGFPQGSTGFQPGGFDPSGLFDQGSGARFGGDGSLGDILGGLFNRSRGPRRAATPSRGANLETDITIDFKEAVLGSSLPIELTRNITCTDCTGSGSATGRAEQCPDCHGTGMTSEEKGAFGFSAPCTRCHGTGQIVTTPCSRCHGAGTVRATKSITVKIPPGVEDGSKLRLAGKGEAGPQGRPSGDLFVNVHVRPDPVFTRDGKDLDVAIPVSFAELALGATLSVPTMTDPVRVKIAPGTPSGRRLRLRGRGVPGSTPGDLYATVNVVVPKDLGPAATSALRAYAQAEKEQGFTPRPDATS